MMLRAAEARGSHRVGRHKLIWLVAIAAQWLAESGSDAHPACGSDFCLACITCDDTGEELPHDWFRHTTRGEMCTMNARVEVMLKAKTAAHSGPARGLDQHRRHLLKST